MKNEKVFAMQFSRIYAALLKKIEGKGRTKSELDTAICWLTGYTKTALAALTQSEASLETFFADAPQMHPNAPMIKGVICGVRIEDIEDPLMQKIRWMDKLADELAKGRAMDKILRA